MYRFAAIHASKAMLARNTNMQGGSRLARVRNYYGSIVNISFGVEARALMLKGVEELADAIRITMGPKGRNVVNAFSPAKNFGVTAFSPATKVGVKVANSIGFKDSVKNAGADFVEQVANATYGFSGDGTTYTTILTHAILAEGFKSVAAGVDAVDIKHGIMMAVEVVLSKLKDRARMISTSEEIAQVATISANGDREIGELIAKAMEKVGKEGIISVSSGSKMYNELQIHEGMQFTEGYISPHFITNSKDQICVSKSVFVKANKLQNDRQELDNPVILIHESKINSVNPILKVSELASKRKRSLLIVAEYVGIEPLRTLIMLNNLHDSIKVCAVKHPFFGFNYRARIDLEDLAIFTGGQIVNEYMDIDDLEFDMLGSCKKAMIYSEKTIIVDGAGDHKTIEEKCKEIRSEIERGEKQRAFHHILHNGYDLELKKRLGNLFGAAAVLEIGGAVESEVEEKQERVEIALRAARAALKGGVLPGGGIALLYASKELEKLQTANLGQKIGVQIIQNALKIPVHTIATNAEVEGTLVVGKLLEQNNPDLGYDAAKGEYVDMVKVGIIDPLKVISTALRDAARVSCLLMTTKSVIFETDDTDDV